MEKTLKAIRFRVTLNGHGVVNYDSNEQKSFLQKHCGIRIPKGKDGAPAENVCYAKKSFTKLSEEEMENLRVKAEAKAIAEGKNPEEVYIPDTKYALKIDSNCLRNAIFPGTSDVDSSIWQFPTAACNYITNPKAHMRGYMCAPEGGCVSGIKSPEVFNKSTCFTVTQAIDNQAQLHMEVFTKSGKRDNTSMFYKETAGETCYTFFATFYVAGAQFLSEDRYFGRLAVNPVYYTEGSNPLEKAFIKRYGRVPYTKGVYTANADVFGDTFGEYGMKMDDEYVNSLIKEAVKCLWEIDIHRAQAEAHTVKVEWKPVFDGVESVNEDWEEVNVNNVPTFQIHQFYTPASQQDWEDRAKACVEVLEAKKLKKEKKLEEKKKRNEEKEKTVEVE